MRNRILILSMLAILVGCASKEHKHPHDHGIDPDVVRLKLAEGEHENHLASLQMQIDGEIKNRNILDDRVTTLEKYAGNNIEQLDHNFGLLKIETDHHKRQIEIIQKVNHYQTVSSVKEYDTLKRSIINLKKEIRALKEKIKPQKLLELKECCPEDE